MRFLPALLALGLLAAATPSSAGCRWFGTQLECALGGSQGLIGTQTRDEPPYVRPLRPEGLSRGGGLPPDRVAPDRPLLLEPENVPPETGLSRKLRNAA